jgi:hypothetical protein
MKSLTVWQPWASLIVKGLKPVEFRSWAPPQSLVGQRIVIHAGKHPPKKGIKHLLASDEHIRSSCGLSGLFDFETSRVRGFLNGYVTDGYSMECCAGLGTAVLGEPQRADNFYRRRGWAVSGGPWNIAWPMLEPEEWPEPVPMRGAQGLWNWPVNARGRS